MTEITLVMIPATDSAIEARPSFLARGAFETALLLAKTSQTYNKVKSKSKPCIAV